MEEKDILQIKPGTKLKMMDEKGVCGCEGCNKWAGQVVTFDHWKNTEPDWTRKLSNGDIERLQFKFKEARNPLFIGNVERIIPFIPEDLFEI